MWGMAILFLPKAPTMQDPGKGSQCACRNGTHYSSILYNCIHFVRRGLQRGKWIELMYLVPFGNNDKKIQTLLLHPHDNLWISHGEESILIIMFICKLGDPIILPHLAVESITQQRAICLLEDHMASRISQEYYFFFFFWLLCRVLNAPKLTFPWVKWMERGVSWDRSRLLEEWQNLALMKCRNKCWQKAQELNGHEQCPVSWPCFLLPVSMLSAHCR